MKDVWAVGDSSSPETPRRTLVEHWDGTAWTRTPAPNPHDSRLDASLSAVTVMSPDDAWAVGYYDTAPNQESPLTIHWNGTKWSRIPAN